MKLLGILLVVVTSSIIESLKQCSPDTYSVSGHYLKDHVMSTSITTSISGCVIQCSLDFRCKSINFHLSTKSCDLNSADRYNHPEDYVMSPLHVYMDTTQRQLKEEGFKSCAEIHQEMPFVESGYYWIMIGGREAQVYCDMSNYGGGWTLVVSVGSTSVDHFLTTATNCLNRILCVPITGGNVTAHKLDDKDIHNLAAYEGTFRMEVLTTGVTAFYQIPSGSRNFNSSCVYGSCPRIIISYSYPYQWETNDCTSIDVGYHIRNQCHRVFDGHDDGECGSTWDSSQLSSKRALYGYYCPVTHAGDPGMSDYKEGLLFVK